MSEFALLGDYHARRLPRPGYPTGVPGARGRVHQLVRRYNFLCTHSSAFPQLEGAGGETVNHPMAAVEIIVTGRKSLRKADLRLAGVKSTSRAERPRVETARNY